MGKKDILISSQERKSKLNVFFVIVVYVGSGFTFNQGLLFIFLVNRHLAETVLNKTFKRTEKPSFLATFKGLFHR